MRLMRLEFEGTTEELEQLPQSMKALFAQTKPPATPPETAQDWVEPSQELREHVASRARSAEVEGLVNRYADEVRSWGGVSYHIGESKNTKDGRTNYFSLYKAGAPTGAFAYVHPSNGKVELRLGPQHAEGRELVKALDREEANSYRVAIFLVSDEALEVAFELTRLAIQEATS